MIINHMSITIEIPEDMKEEFNEIPDEQWQLLFSQFMKNKLDERKKWNEVKKIIDKSQMTQEQADELADEVSIAIARRIEDKINANSS